MAFGGLALLAWLASEPQFYAALGVAVPSSAMALILFLLVIPVFAFFLTPLTSWWSRRHERQADDFAAAHADAGKLAAALVKLFRDNASTLTPDRLHSAFFDSHPPALERIGRLSRLVAAYTGADDPRRAGVRRRPADLSVRGRARHGTGGMAGGDDRRPGEEFCLAARSRVPPALPWINVWALEDGDGWTLVDTGLKVAGQHRCVAGGDRRRPLRHAGPTRAGHPHASRPLRHGRLDRAAFRRAVVDVPPGISDVPPDGGGHRTYRAPRGRCFLPGGRLGRWCDRALQGEVRILRRDDLSAAGRLSPHRRPRGDSRGPARLARGRRQRPLAGARLPPRSGGQAPDPPATRSCRASPRTCLHGLSDQSPTPTRSPTGWSSLADIKLADCRTTCWCFLRSNSPFRGLHARLDTLMETHRVNLARVEELLMASRVAPWMYSAPCSLGASMGVCSAWQPGKRSRT